jgi:hypothetical protein
MYNALPRASMLIADRRYGSKMFRSALKAKGAGPCMPPTRSGSSFSPATTASLTLGTEFRTCSRYSKTSDALPPAATDAPTLSFRQSASPQPSDSF